MDLKSVAKGAAAGAAVGFACYVFSSAKPMKKRNIRKDAGKTLKAAENLINDITSVFM